MRNLEPAFEGMVLAQMSTLIKFSLGKIKSVFSSKKEMSKKEKPLRSHATHLNFFLLSAALKLIQKQNPKKDQSAFFSKVLTSKSMVVTSQMKQTESVCNKQDIELFLYKELFSENHFSLKNAIQLNFSKYIKSQKEAMALISKMKGSSSDTFKCHLITLLKEENLSPDSVEKEARYLEEEWKQYHLGQGSSSPVSCISPL